MEYQPENRVCQNCKKDFTIESDDFSFYEKMKVNVPDFCPMCGLSIITSLRNERVVYWNTCAKCGDKIMSTYSSKSPYTVYCHDCWWGSDWDGSLYLKNYDFSKTLLEQFKELQKQVPRESLVVLNSTNCYYGNHVRDSKNCFFTFLCSDSENILYSIYTVTCKDCMENHKISHSELTVYSIDVVKCYKSAFLQDSSDCSFCYFGYDLKNCNNCLFCFNLRNKSYHIRNKPVTKEEYENEFKKIFCGSYKILSSVLNEFEDIKKQAIHRYALTVKSNNVIGNYLQNCDRNYWVFDGTENQDVRYSANVLFSKNTYYSYAIGVQPTESIFGGCVIKGGSTIKNSYNLFNCSNCSWCDSLISCHNCVACVGLKNKDYCILNKQYTKEEYNKIISHLEKNGELSLFMKSEFSTFSYNETAAIDHFPISELEAKNRGFHWQEEIPFTFGKETIPIENLPDNINDMKNILNEIFACIKCKRNYRIVEEELKYIREFKLPIPRECPQCRMAFRRSMRLPFKLWHRKCMKPGCTNEFETSYAPDRPEIIYCEKCYQQEVY